MLNPHVHPLSQIFPMNMAISWSGLAQRQDADALEFASESMRADKEAWGCFKNIKPYIWDRRWFLGLMFNIHHPIFAVSNVDPYILQYLYIYNI